MICDGGRCLYFFGVVTGVSESKHVKVGWWAGEAIAELFWILLEWDRRECYTTG